MIQVIEAKGFTVTSFEEQWKKEGKISVGYLAASAKNNRNIGMQLVGYFLDAFPETDVQWLVTGKRLSRNTDKKHTAATNVDEAALLREEMADLRDQIAFLSKQNSDLSANNRKLTERLLGRKVVEQG